ncbi:MAG: FkbM family methyltransferase [Vannielia sp.]|uniref:FkbM family methyltransferase n=1 Tax=Vannielia sp. TaxID=2813045 RepID=UPI003B8C1355
MIAIDLGANQGAFTARLAETASKVYAFEPDPWSLKRLRGATAGCANVDIIEAAAGVEDGKAEIFRHEAFAERPEEVSLVSTVMPDFSAADHSGTAMKVPMVDFIAFLAGLEGRIGLLKIDIEGAEVPLLEALFESDQAERIDYIFCETHEPDLPKLAPRYKALRDRAARMSRPVVNLDWQ